MHECHEYNLPVDVTEWGIWVLNQDRKEEWLADPPEDEKRGSDACKQVFHGQWTREPESDREQYDSENQTIGQEQCQTTPELTAGHIDKHAPEVNVVSFWITECRTDHTEEAGHCSGPGDHRQRYCQAPKARSQQEGQAPVCLFGAQYEDGERINWVGPLLAATEGRYRVLMVHAVYSCREGDAAHVNDLCIVLPR
jgi:hypothetical protein